MKKVSISLCMITQNEEKFIARALKNVRPYVDEMIVVDGGSTDKTVEIAEKLGAKVVFNKWEEHFAKQRNVSLRLATKKWILVIDADETYDKKLLQELQKMANNNMGIEAFAFPRKNYIDGKLIDAYPDRQVRFFKNSSKIKYRNRLHENVVGFKWIASPIDLHIIHKKTSKRQAKQNKHYKTIEKIN